MVKKGTNIRAFTPKQKQQMEAIAAEQKLKTAPDILFFALEGYTELRQQNVRLMRILETKKAENKALKEQLKQKNLHADNKQRN